MSTNYYFTPSEDNPLSVFGEIHIGKQSGGWVFSFHGYSLQGGTTRVEVDRYSGLTVPVEIPALVVKSAAMWKETLKYGVIKNEYGETISAEDFWNNRISRPDETFNGSRLRVHSKEYGGDSDRNWIDAEGYSFSGYDFS